MALESRSGSYSPSYEMPKIVLLETTVDINLDFALSTDTAGRRLPGHLSSCDPLDATKPASFGSKCM